MSRRPWSRRRRIGDIGLLGLGLLAAGAQLRQAELADLLGEARVEDPVDAALAARHYLHAHPSPPVALDGMERGRL
jgi:hypothetical protein